MAARYWTCRTCKHRNARTSSQRCQGCSKLTKPKPRVPKHAETLRDHTYADYAAINEAIHGAGETCGVCGTPPKGRSLQREHDHATGRPRGLACWRCNRLMPKQFTLVEARAIVAYLERVEAHYGGAA